MENVNLDLIPRDGDRALKELSDGNMIVARSNNDFLYVVEFDGKFHMFSHTPGSPGGGQKQFPHDEKYTAVIRKLTDLADALYKVDFDKDMNLYGVMYAAEEGILSMFPGDSRDNDEDIEFVIKGEE
jgi:hypothetical protein